MFGAQGLGNGAREVSRARAQSVGHGLRFAAKGVDGS